MKIGFTGTRMGMTEEQRQTVAGLLQQLPDGDTPAESEFHHGACVGADEQAAMIAGNLGYHLVAHPGIVDGRWRSLFVSHEERELMPTLVRNRDIVAEAELVIATPFEKHPRRRGSGTWATIREALKASKPLYVVWSDGSMDFSKDER